MSISPLVDCSALTRWDAFSQSQKLRWASHEGGKMSCRCGNNPKAFIVVDGLHSRPASVELANPTLAFYTSNLSNVPKNAILHIIPKTYPDFVIIPGGWSI